MKPNLKRQALVLLLLMLLGVLLCACRGNAPDGNETESVFESEEETADQPIVLASNGSSDFTIWIAEDIHSNGTLRDAVDDLVEKQTNAARFALCHTILSFRPSLYYHAPRGHLS